MSLRLRLVGGYFGASAIRSNLLAVEQVTNAALDSVLKANVVGYKPQPLEAVGKDVDLIRSRMAKGHKERVRVLLDAVGREKGIELGRAALYDAGMALGENARGRLGVKDSNADLERAAKLIYRILGITIEMTFNESGGEMKVTTCALAKDYDEDTCRVLSATDEGMIHGLSGRATMQFKERITGGALCCTSVIEFKGAEK